MALVLVTGRANAGKSGLLYSPLIEAARSGREAVLLLPSHAEVVRARAEFSTRAPVGISVDTIDGWAQTLWALHGDGRRPIDAVSRRVAVQVASSPLSGVLEGSSRYAGFDELMAQVCTRSAGEALGQPTDDVSAEVAEIVQRYRRLVCDWGLIEPGEMLAELPHALQGPLPLVSINRFSDFSVQQQRFIRGISQRTDVFVGITYERGFFATEALETVVGSMTASGAREEHVATDTPHSELEQLESALFSGAHVQSRGHVRFVEAAGPEAEIAAIADSVAEAIADGMSASRVTVVFRQVASRWQLLEAALRARGVRTDVDISLPLVETPLGRAMLGIVSLALRRSGGREELVALLAGRFFGTEADSIIDLDRKWRTRRIDDTRRLLDDACKSDPVTKRVVELARSLADGGDSGGWIGLADLLIETGLRRPVTETGARLDAAVHRAVCDSATRLAALPGPLPIEQFITALQAESVSTGSGAESDALLLTEAHRIRGRRFDVVIVGGLSAAEFSSGQREPLSATLLRRMGIDVGTDEQLAERMLFYTIATRARERLILVRQAADQRGEQQRPSLFWEECLDLYRDKESERVLAPVDQVGLTEPHRATPRFSGGRSALKELAYRGEIEFPGATRGRLTKPLPRRTPDEYSVTEIEAYLSCPYRWFYDRIVRPREMDRSFDAAEKGSAAHWLLAQTYRALRAEGIDRIDPESLERGRVLMLEQAQRLSADSRFDLRGVEEELSWDQAVRWGLAILEQDQEFLLDFRPFEEEYRFGEAAGRPFSLGGVALRGSVDRVDRGSEGAVVTDYKSSASVRGWGSWVDKRLLQPIVYASAVGELTGLPVVAAIYRSLSTGSARGFWNGDLAFPDPSVTSGDVSGEGAFAGLLEWAESAVAEAVSGMRAGSIPRRPMEGACSYCGARDFCEERR